MHHIYTASTSLKSLLLFIKKSAAISTFQNMPFAQIRSCSARAKKHYALDESGNTRDKHQPEFHHINSNQCSKFDALSPFSVKIRKWIELSVSLTLEAEQYARVHAQRDSPVRNVLSHLTSILGRKKGRHGAGDRI